MTVRHTEGPRERERERERERRAQPARYCLLCFCTVEREREACITQSTRDKKRGKQEA